MVMHDVVVGCAAHAVQQPGIQLGESIHFIRTDIRDVSHNSRLSDVSNDKLLDTFVLGGTVGIVGAAHVLAVAKALLGVSVASSFQSHNGSASDQKRVTVF